ncbi:MAG TPA: PAS domain-containing protein, partial [Patescibacteria group bacterium]|nr:PAS domain-containing protein [Patescibacteria group bacterium]
MEEIEIARFDRYRKKVQIFIWILICTLALLINVVPLQEFIVQRNILNGILFFAALYTLFYYQVIVPLFQKRYIIFASVIVYIFFVFVIVDRTGFLTSVFFPLLYIPIIIGGMLLGRMGLFLTFAVEFLLILIPLTPQLPTVFTFPGALLFGKQVGSLLLVAFLSYFISQEIDEREEERHVIEKEREKAKKVAVTFREVTGQLQIDAKLLLKRDLELREVNEAIDRAKTRYETILDSIVDGVVVLNSKRNIVSFNRVSLELLDVKEQDMRQKSIDELLILHDDNRRVTSLVYSSQKGRVRTFHRKGLRLESSNEKVTHVDLTVSPLIAKGKLPEGYVLALKDVSREHELEEMKLDFVS